MRYLILLLMILTLAMPAMANYWTDAADHQAAVDTVMTQSSDSLFDEYFGATFAFREAAWVDAGRNRCSISVRTNHDARVTVRWGLTTSYTDSVTDASGHRFRTHLRTLSGLSPSTEYHYQIAAYSGDGDAIETADATFTTVAGTGWIDVATLGDPPYTLSTSDATYYLSEDVDADLRAFTITGDDVTLDLNGYTVTYDNATSPYGSGNNWWIYEDNDDSSFGVFWDGPDRITIIGGAIVQGTEQSGGSTEGYCGFNPVYSRNSTDCNLTAVRIDYGGSDIRGCWLRASTNAVLAYNDVFDRGSVLNDRQNGVRALAADADNVTFLQNLVRRARHRGLSGYSLAEKNEVYVDSFGINAYGYDPQGDVTVAVASDNIACVNGLGAVGFAWIRGANEAPMDSVVFRDNFIYGICYPNDSGRLSEYGNVTAASGFRLTQYENGSRVYNGYVYVGNYFLSHPRGDMQIDEDVCEPPCGRPTPEIVRGMWITTDPAFTDYEIRDNTIKIVVQGDECEPDGGCIVLQGLSDQQRPAGDLVTYQDNRLISNYHMIRVGDRYVSGRDGRFVGTTFERVAPTHPLFGVVALGHENHNDLRDDDVVLIDSTFLGGCDADDYWLHPWYAVSDEYYYQVGHTVWIELQDDQGTPLAGEEATISDDQGYSYTSTADGEGGRPARRGGLRVELPRGVQLDLAGSSRRLGAGVQRQHRRAHRRA
jgi:hypothetical protein